MLEAVLTHAGKTNAAQDAMKQMEDGQIIHAITIALAIRFMQEGMFPIPAKTTACLQQIHAIHEQQVYAAQQHAH